MEERSPGGFSPTKWAQFANSTRPGRRGPGGRGRGGSSAGPPLSSPPAPGAALTFRAGGEAEGEGKATGSGRFFFSSEPFLRPSSAPAEPGRGRGPQPRRENGRAGAEGEAAPPRPAQTSAAGCSPSPHPGRHPRPPLPGRGARSGRPPRRRGDTSRLRCGARFSRRLGERWRRHWENGGRAPFPSPPLI